MNRTTKLITSDNNLWPDFIVIGIKSGEDLFQIKLGEKFKKYIIGT